MARDDQVSQALGALIDRHAARLTEADARLLDVLVRDPVRGALENGKDVSQRAGVHPASAVRLARRLGFAGYPEFRAFLQASLIEGGEDFADPAARVAARLCRAGESSVLGSLAASEIAALERLTESVRDADIRGFAERLRDARRIFVAGGGHAAALAALIALRLCRSGYDAVDLGARMHQLSEALASIGGEDVLWVLAFRRRPPAIERIGRVAAARGAQVLALTDRQADDPELRPAARISISRGAPGESQSLVAPMTVANAVVLDLAAIDGGRSLRALTEFRRFRATCGL